MDIALYFLHHIDILNVSTTIWDKPFKIITTKNFLYIADKENLRRGSYGNIIMKVDISKRQEELVAQAKALVEQHELNLLTDYYKHPIDLFSLMQLLTDQLGGMNAH